MIGDPQIGRPANDLIILLLKPMGVSIRNPEGEWIGNERICSTRTEGGAVDRGGDGCADWHLDVLKSMSAKAAAACVMEVRLAERLFTSWLRNVGEARGHAQERESRMRKKKKRTGEKALGGVGRRDGSVRSVSVISAGDRE